MLRLLFRRIARLLLWLGLLSMVWVLLLRWINPPFTALMVERRVEAWVQGASLDIQQDWQPWGRLPDALKIAVLAAEDQKFAAHWGFDLAAIQAALAHNDQGGSLRGASTISQQVAKNLFLWSDRSWLRKGLEAWFTLLIESFWSKQRILEVYLNSVEWGEGIFGAQAAAKHYFSLSAQGVSDTQASLLSAILPNPRVWSASQPSAYISRRASWIRQQMRQLGSQYLEPLNNH